MGKSVRRHQTTIARKVELSGIGVHSGSAVKATLFPADPNTGVNFTRSDLTNNASSELEAHYTNVCATELCTVIGNDEGLSVSTVEHLLAALNAMGIDNVLVELDGPEMPIMDGSSCAFIDALKSAGIKKQRAARKYLKILKPIRIESGRSSAQLRPFDGFMVDVEIDFSVDLIGRQRFAMEVNAAAFEKEVCRARTFGFMKDVERLWAAGYAQGASLENTIAIGEDRILNPEGTRFPDEFVRHKALDAIGDLMLAGMPILGAYTSYCGGHKVNVMMLEALFEDPTSYEIVSFDADAERVSGDVDERLPVAAFAPNVS